MSSHSHKLNFLRGATWRCIIPGCKFFIHEGLQHILYGRILTCCSCEKEFVLEEIHLVESQFLICGECKSSFSRDVLKELIKGWETEQ